MEVAPSGVVNNPFQVLGDLEEEWESEFPELGIPVPEVPKECEGGNCSCARGKMRRFDRKKGKAVRFGDMSWDSGDEVFVGAVDKPGDLKTKSLKLAFQVADVKKPLIAVKRVTEKGNHVAFGPQPNDNFIENRVTGDKMFLRPNGNGSYLMDVEFEGGGKTTITVDSGAEENVCPKVWGNQFKTREVEKKMNLRNASGGKIEHFGERDVIVKSPF